MLNTFKNTIKKNKEVTLLIAFSVAFFVLINSSFLLPIVVSITISYLLYNIKFMLKKLGLPEIIAFLITYSIFITLFSTIFSILLPNIFKQSVILINDMPLIMQKVKIITYKLTKKYIPMSISEQTNLLFSNAITYTQGLGKAIISTSLLSIAIIIKWIIYAFLIPILVFFFLKDHDIIIQWFSNIMPEKSFFWKKIWKHINTQINNYVLGKIIEIIIISIMTYILFKYYDLAYADLLAISVGMSVVMPYVGALVVSAPVIFTSAVQFGLSNDFFYLNLTYAIIQIFDGNILVPVLFSEVVKLHPISIILSVIIFGATMGIYGVFFCNTNSNSNKSNN